MQVEFDIKYLRSKKKVAKKLNLKKIVCRRDKNKLSIRVLGSDGYRILLTTKNNIVIFQDIMNHDKYDRLTKDC
jgi:hypothetical protein